MTDRLPRVDDADLEHWRQVWEQDLRPELPRTPGFRSRIGDLIRTLLRPFVRTATADLWERQRRYNQLLQHHLEGRLELAEAFREHQRASSRDQELLQRQITEVSTKLEAAIHQTYDELVGYSDSSFARLDHKLDEYRQQAADLHAKLVSLLRVAESGGSGGEARGRLATAVEEQSYLDFEHLHRGTEEEIAERLQPYLSFLERAHDAHTVDGEAGLILDLGCGRGEALEVFRDRGWPCRGVDSNARMIERCQAKGLDAVAGDLFEVLAETPAGSLTGVVSFHVIEHLAGADIDRLVSAAWQALKPGGVLVLETPSPLSLMVGASSFWRDPTHVRPVHPDSLRFSLESAGFEEIERIGRQPFADDQRLPTIDTGGLEGDILALAEQMNHFRDRLDALVFGFQDYGMVGRR